MESVLKEVMQSMMDDNFELYRASFNDSDFRKSMLDYEYLKEKLNEYLKEHGDHFQ